MCQAVSQTCFEVVTSTDTSGELRGELDLVTAPDLERLLDQLHRDSHRQVTFDLSRLEFLSTARLSMLLRTDHAVHVDTTLIISEPTEWVGIGEYVNSGDAK
jgi:anti-anti-sigma regulatory factor